MASEFDFEFEDEKKSGGLAIDPKLLLIKIVGYWPILIISVAIALLVVFIYHRYTNERFRLSSTLLIPEANADLDPSLLSIFSLSNTSNFLNELEILRSERITALAIDSLEFGTEYYSKGRIKTIEEYKSLPFEIKSLKQTKQLYGKMYRVEFLEGNLFHLGLEDDEFTEESPTYSPFEDIISENYKFRLEVPGQANLAGKEYFFRFRERKSLIDEWNNRLGVTYQREFTSVAALSVSYTNARKGADFLNAIMKAYMNEELDRKNTSAEKTIRFVDREMAALNDTLELYASQLDQIKGENRVTSFDQVGNNLMSRITQLEVEKGVNERVLSALRRNLSYLEDTAKINDLTAVPLTAITDTNDTEIQRYIGLLQEKLSEKQERSTVLSETTPEIMGLIDQINSLTNLITNSVNSKISELEAKNQSIENQIDQLDIEFQRYPESQREYGDIERVYDLYYGMFQFFRERRAEAGILRASNEANSRIVDEATSNVLPVFPNKGLNYTIGGALGLILPLVFFCGERNT